MGTFLSAVLVKLEGADKSVNDVLINVINKVSKRNIEKSLCNFMNKFVQCLV